jgi:outer membrane lipoprotein-sorting protein
LVFDAQERLHAMMIDDGLGQKTEIKFHNVRENVPIVDTDYVFVIPPGVDVVREATAS